MKGRNNRKKERSDGFNPEISYMYLSFVYRGLVSAERMLKQYEGDHSNNGRREYLKAYKDKIKIQNTIFDVEDQIYTNWRVSLAKCN